LKQQRVGSANPASARNSVVFPAPLSPRIAWNLPASKSAGDAAECGKAAELLDEVADGDDSLGGRGLGGTYSHGIQLKLEDSESAQ